MRKTTAAIKQSPPRNGNRIPLWVKIPYTLMVCIIVPVYWRDLGPANFLWFSDIALIVLVPALWLENRFLASTMAVAVLIPELAWVVDFLSGSSLFQIAAYMFSDETSLHIRILSGTFHLALPPVLLLMLGRYGYDRRAFAVQSLIALVVVPLSRLVSGPKENINWVYGPAEPQTWLPDPVYLGLLLLAFIFVIYLPSHLLFIRLFPCK